MKKIILLTIVLLSTFNSSFAQKEINNWFLGWNFHMNFNTSPLTVKSFIPTSLQEYVFTNESSCTISDSAGNLILFSNGLQIWNKYNDTIEGGNNLNGNVSTAQGCLILKKPDSNNIFYVFTLDQLGRSKGLCYSIVDIFLNNGKGKVIAKNVQLYTSSTEQLHATLHKNQTDIWIVSHEKNSINFRANLLTKNGLNHTPVISNVDKPIDPYYHLLEQTNLGIIKISPQGNKIVINRTCYVPSIQIGDFDNCTGKISNVKYIDFALLQPRFWPESAVYGAEFSPDGNFLYVTSEADIFQLDLSYNNVNDIVQNRVELGKLEDWNRFFGLQMGPDKKIYIARNDRTMKIGIINSPNEKGHLSNVTSKNEPQIYTLFGLPTFLSNYYNFNPFIEIKKTCSVEGSVFKVKNIDSTTYKKVEWTAIYENQVNALNIGEGAKIQYHFVKFGKYTIDAKIINNNDSIWHITTNFFLPPPNLNFPKDTLVCNSIPITLKIPSQSICNYSGWKTINDSLVFDSVYTITKAGKYFINVGYADCTLKDSINVSIIDSKPALFIGNDTTLCKTTNNVFKLQNKFTPTNTTYLWNNSSVNNYININSSGKYSVSVKNACGYTYDSISVKFDETPYIDLGNDIDICKSEKVTLLAKSNLKTFQWNTGNKDSSITVESSGHYFAQVYNTCGIATDTVFVNVINISDLTIPNIITPNNDGLNETFIADNHLLGSELTIYNRWGTNCYYNKNYDNTWDGNNLADGIYFYEFNNTCFKQIIKDWIQIAR